MRLGWTDHVWIAGGQAAKETYSKGYFCQEFKLVGPGSWTQLAELSYISMLIKEEFPMLALKIT